MSKYIVSVEMNSASHKTVHIGCELLTTHFEVDSSCCDGEAGFILSVVERTVKAIEELRVRNE